MTCSFVWRDYASGVDLRLKSRDMITVINILPSEDFLSRAMDDVMRRGLPYNIVINAQNELHRSITLKILHGTPQGSYLSVVFAPSRDFPVQSIAFLLFLILKYYLLIELAFRNVFVVGNVTNCFTSIHRCCLSSLCHAMMSSLFQQSTSGKAIIMSLNINYQLQKDIFWLLWSPIRSMIDSWFLSLCGYFIIFQLWKIWILVKRHFTSTS